MNTYIWTNGITYLVFNYVCLSIIVRYIVVRGNMNGIIKLYITYVELVFLI